MHLGELVFLAEFDQQKYNQNKRVFEYLDQHVPSVDADLGILSPR